MCVNLHQQAVVGLVELQFAHGPGQSGNREQQSEAIAARRFHAFTVQSRPPVTNKVPSRLIVTAVVPSVIAPRRARSSVFVAGVQHAQHSALCARDDERIVRRVIATDKIGSSRCGNVITCCPFAGSRT